MRCIGLYLGWASAMALGLMAPLAPASTAVLPPQSRMTGALELIDTEYSTTDNNNFDATGDLLAVGYEALVNKVFSAGVNFGVLVNGQTTGDIRLNTGSGFRLGLDANLLVTKINAGEFIGMLGFQQDRFTFTQNNAKLTMTTTDLSLGGIFRHRLKQFEGHGGVQLFLIDSANLTTSFGGVSGSTTAKRNQQFNLLLGGGFAVSPDIDLRLDLRLLGEEAIVLAVDFKI